MKTDSKGHPYVEYEGRRITFIPKGRNGDNDKDWSGSAVIRIQAHRYDKKTGKELSTLCPGAELPIESFDDLGIIFGLLAEVVSAGFKKP